MSLGGIATTTYASRLAISDSIADDLEPFNTTDMPNPPSKISFALNIEIIFISAFLFISIFSWFEFLRALFDETFYLKEEKRFEVAFARFWYAIFITSLCAVLIYIVYRIGKMMNKHKQ